MSADNLQLAFDGADSNLTMGHARLFAAKMAREQGNETATRVYLVFARTNVEEARASLDWADEILRSRRRHQARISVPLRRKAR